MAKRSSDLPPELLALSVRWLDYRSFLNLKCVMYMRGKALQKAERAIAKQFVRDNARTLFKAYDLSRRRPVSYTHLAARLKFMLAPTSFSSANITLAYSAENGFFATCLVNRGYMELERRPFNMHGRFPEMFPHEIAKHNARAISRVCASTTMDAPVFVVHKVNGMHLNTMTIEGFREMLRHQKVCVFHVLIKEEAQEFPASCRLQPSEYASSYFYI